MKKIFHRTGRAVADFVLMDGIGATMMNMELVGVSRNTISSIETGQFCPTAKLALILCIALDKKFEEVFYF